MGTVTEGTGRQSGQRLRLTRKMTERGARNSSRLTKLSSGIGIRISDGSLYLIQNSIFGVDIQSIACQIAKLRFFISLAIEQLPDKGAENFGIKPLPNLETRFIAANTLIGLTIVRDLTSGKAQDIERQLRDNRERYFHATTRRQKLNCRRRDKNLRGKLAEELTDIGMPADEAGKIAYWDPYDQNASTDFFNTEWMFGIADGFDVVIGNPPYVDSEMMTKNPI